ncbi:ML domain-containing protein [Hirsutella rhossiliensis]|uniref:Phosphatidylglycerol/phosphatidylinositol transfer protein n=1 Tax=Hirsutella rhossiliensis TaxID=111463 RepID=A0A9P8N450_9HYPO|nr:ML domain-containing protein [Hirsutella rhossiliensis]KAH0965489.1 ML domain-containing protein [Hirsutella rhossiliensis]
MKFPVTVACLSALLAPAAVLGDDRIKVPGDNPLYHCPGDIARDEVQITSVNLTPNPPAMGRDLVINATGTVKTTIERNAKVHLVVKMGLLTLVNREEDLCDQVRHVDLECPIKNGTMNIVKTVSLPGHIPPGPFTVEANARTADDKPITCLQGNVVLENSFFNIEL